ncbi:MAG: ABC transporter ATP-binding protein [Thermodesulfobacteriota bacterium]|nr:ABC transporter ATP-binding protein [Thermodesulfobacteriota bacterium]
MTLPDKEILRTYIWEFFLFARLKAFVSLFLLILLGLSEGIGLLMLIPFLHLAGVADTGASTSGSLSFIADLFRAIHLPMTLPVALCIYVGIISFHAILSRWQMVINAGINHGFTRFLRNRLYDSLTHADWLFITRNRSADMTHVLTSELQRVGYGTHHFLLFISNGVISAVHIGIALMLSVPMTGIALACAMIMLSLLRPQNRKSYRIGMAIHRTMQGLYTAVTEHLGGIKAAKSYNAEQRHIQDFHSVNRGIETLFIRFAKVMGDTQMFYNIGSVVAISIFFYSAVGIFRIPLTHLLLLIFIFARLLPKFSLLQQSYLHLVNMLPAFTAATDMLDRCRLEKENSSALCTDPIRLEKGIAFHRVSFRYDKKVNSYALYEVDITFPARCMTAIVGPSGAGKSTLADLIMGLLIPVAGRILIDDIPLTPQRIYRWRQSVAYVPQETFLFHDTIRANLLWVKPDANEEELWEVLRISAADGFVSEMAFGLDTVIGDRGIRLSGGEKQRLALARGLLRKPDLLLLDEATSALDAENERRIQESIWKLYGKLTIVIIAHRLSTIRKADSIVVLDGGRVVETGTWCELAAHSNSKFQSLIKGGDLQKSLGGITDGI